MLTQNGKKKILLTSEKPTQQMPCTDTEVCVLPSLGPRKKKRREEERTTLQKSALVVSKGKEIQNFFWKRILERWEPLQFLWGSSLWRVRYQEDPEKPRSSRHPLHRPREPKAQHCSPLRLTHHIDCNHVQNTLNAFPNVCHGSKTTEYQPSPEFQLWTMKRMVEKSIVDHSAP